MAVQQVDDGVKVQPNHVYVIPPNRNLELRNGTLILTKPSEPSGLRLPIDHFFRSLANDQRERAICIVLSGNGSDGALGIGAVKEADGMIVVQKPETATYTGMPESAIATGLADLILPPEEMPQALMRYKEISVIPSTGSKTAETDESIETLRAIYAVLRNRSGHDFSN